MGMCLGDNQQAILGHETRVDVKQRKVGGK